MAQVGSIEETLSNNENEDWRIDMFNNMQIEEVKFIY